MAAGIVRRHSRGCATRSGGRCDCHAGWEASVYITRDERKLRKTFPSLAAARAWRTQAAREAQLGGLRAPSPITVREAATEWLHGVQAGAIRNRSGDLYKPSARRGYEQALRLRVLPALGAHKLADVRTPDVQLLVDRWQAAGLSPSVIRNTLLPLRVIYRRALARPGRRQPHQRPGASGRTRATRPHRLTRRGRAAVGRAGRTRAHDLGHGDVRRPAPG